LKKRNYRIDCFDLPSGFRILNKYKVVSKLGGGWEGEVYRIVEMRTGIERAAKLFYPQRNLANRASRRYAKKLHKLRNCSLLIQYHTEERFRFNDIPVTILISEYVEGRPLSEFIRELPGRRLSTFEALHLLYVLAIGMEQIHREGEYHGDLHLENIITKRVGLTFEPKIFDPFHWETPKAENKQEDICDLIRVFYEILGGARTYRRQPEVVKFICCGLKRSLILRKFRKMSHIRKYLETMEW